MADHAHDLQTPSTCADHSEPPDQIDSGVELEFPHLLLQTSLESLLTCSYQSSASGTTAKMPSLPEHEPLDESWASLDTEDYSHDYDTRSESADNVSLLDAATTEDEESVVDDEVEGDVEAGDDSVNASSPTIQNSKEESSQPRPGINAEDDDLTSDTIVLSPIQPQFDPLSLQIGIKRQFSFATGTDTNKVKCNTCNENLKMSVSYSQLATTSRPFHVGYYGTASTTETKDQVLGKVGSALVVTRSMQGSSTYHVAPSEFDADLKPQSAELVPSDVQMYVEQITIVKSSDHNLLLNGIDVAFKDGTIIRSKKSKASKDLRTIWHPDLLLVHASSDDVRYDIQEVEKLLELAKRHQIPTLVVADDSACVLPIHDAASLHRVLEWKDSMGVIQHIQTAAIDLDQFVRLDSAQLNRHIKFLTDRSQEQLSSIKKNLTLTHDFFQKCGLARCLLSDQGDNMWTQERVVWPGKIHKPHPGQAPSPSERNFIHFVQSLPLQALLAASAKSLLVALVLVLLGFLIPYGSYLKYTDTVLNSTTSTEVVQNIIANSDSQVATQSSSYASSASVVTSTDLVPSDILAYLLGPKPIQGLESDATVATNSDSQPLEETNSDISVSHEDDFLSKLQGIVDKLQQDLQFQLVRAQETLNDEKLYAHTKFLDLKHEGVESLQSKLQQQLESFSTNVQMLNKWSRTQVEGMVIKSQTLVNRSRELAGEHSRRIIKEQKEVLAAASKHARTILRHIREAKTGRNVEGDL